MFFLRCHLDGCHNFMGEPHSPAPGNKTGMQLRDFSLVDPINYPTLQASCLDRTGAAICCLNGHNGHRWMNDSSIAGAKPLILLCTLAKICILCFKDPRRERKVRTAWYFHMLSHTFTYFHILSHTSSTGYIYFGSTQEHASTLQLRTSALANFSQWNSNLHK